MNSQREDELVAKSVEAMPEMMTAAGTVRMTENQIWVISLAVQLACRDSGLDTFVLKQAREAVELLVSGLAERRPFLQEIFDAGWNSANDGPMPKFQRPDN